MKLSLVISSCVLLGVASVGSNADAAYLYDWSVTPDIVAADDQLQQATDILAAWHETDGAYHYFRMDIEAAPGLEDYADIYGIYIDAIPGGNQTNIDYVPYGLQGIDFILDSHFNPYMSGSGGNGWTQNDFHYNWDGSLYSVSIPVAVQLTENGGTTLEWQISVASIGTDFTWRAATHMLTPGYDTRDITVASQVTATSDVPLPASILFFGAGLFGLAARRKLV